VLDPDALPRDPRIAAALGPVRAAVHEARGRGLGHRVLVAVSGGRDSLVALGLLLILARSEALELCVGHVDHGLRPDSRDEAEHVARIAAALDLPCRAARLELERGRGLPARARAARRAALAGQAEAWSASAIVLAHTATDQAETMLMHMFRGAGLDGLAAMRTWEPPYLRPILSLTRAQTTELCAVLELPYVDDPTNLDLDAERVWLRERVFARVRTAHPQFERRALGLAREAGEADAALLIWAGREVDARAREQRGSWSLEGFEQLPRAIRTRALRLMCEQCGVEIAQLRRRVVEAMDAAAIASVGSPPPGPRGWDLHPKRRIVIDKNGLHTAPA